MDNIIKKLITLSGIILIGYGLYRIITPEASVDIGIAEFNSQNNKDAFITLGLGILILIISFVVKKK